jgi:hypothetical protein
MVIQELAPGGGSFFASGLTIVGNGTLAYRDPCVPCEDYSTVMGNSS